MSNSKLTPGQQSTLKIWKEVNPTALFFSFPEYGVTILAERRVGNMWRFSCAIASPGEKKFRRKVGEWCALQRWWDGVTLPAVIYANGYHGIHDQIEDLAAVLGHIKLK
jgi:hypothetical protein